MLRYAFFVIRRIRILRFSTLFSRHSQQRTASTSIQDQPSNSSITATATQTTPKYLFHFMIRPIVISGPSGGGKSTILTKAMKEHSDAFAFSVSHTTRKPRANEIDGEHYHFVDRAEMEQMIAANEFIEYAQFGGNLYGTSKRSCEQVSKSGKICVLDVELQGVRNFKKENFDANYILVLPPSLKKLEERLRQRGTETEDSIKKRLEHAREDMDAVDKEPEPLFDHIIINDDLEKAYQEFLTAIKKDARAKIKLEETKSSANKQMENGQGHPMV